MKSSVLDRLDTLHETYVEAINEAVAADRHEGVRRLSVAYDHAAARLLAESFGLQDDAPVAASRRSRFGRLVQGRRAA